MSVSWNRNTGIIFRSLFNLFSIRSRELATGGGRVWQKNWNMFLIMPRTFSRLPIFLSSVGYIPEVATRVESLANNGLRRCLFARSAGSWRCCWLRIAGSHDMSRNRLKVVTRHSGCPTSLSRHRLALQFRVSIVVSIWKGTTLSAFFVVSQYACPYVNAITLSKKLSTLPSMCIALSESSCALNRFLPVWDKHNW